MESEADVKEENQEDRNHGQDRKRKRSRWYAPIKLSFNKARPNLIFTKQNKYV